MPKKGSLLPTLVSKDVVEKYERDGIGRPSLPDKALDWTSSLTKCSWNKDAIVILAKDFKDILQPGLKYPYVKDDKKNLKLKSLALSCRKKLLPIWHMINKLPKSDSLRHPGMTLYELWKLRRYSCQTGVSCTFFITLYLNNST